MYLLKHLSCALTLGALALSPPTAQAQAASGTWGLVAAENQAFSITGAAKTVRYGAGTRWVSKVVAGDAVCSNAYFGSDPIRGTLKRCEAFTPAPAAVQALPHPSYATLWNHQQIQLTNALGLVSNPTPAKKIRIAVIDGGASPHPDIGWAKADNGSALTLNALVDWTCLTTTDPSFCARLPKDPYDTDAVFKHGTHVMGIINGQNPLRGRYGVCPASVCEVVSIKTNISDVLSLTAAIKLARHHKVDVINMSFNYRLPTVGCDKSSLEKSRGEVLNGNLYEVKTALDAAMADGISVVNSAGNFGSVVGSNGLPQNDVKNEFPGGCPGIITAGAASPAGDLASEYSNHGSQIFSATGAPQFTAINRRPLSTLTLIAPGGGVENNTLFGSGIDCPNIKGTSTAGVYSASFDDAAGKACYRYASGTSMAAPHVSAVIGLMVAERAAASLPRLSPKDIKDILMASATDVASSPKCQPAGRCGSGRLNAYEAVRMARTYTSTAPPPVASTGPCSLGPVGALCKLDAIAYDTDTVNFKEETVIAYGKMWKFNPAGTATLSGKDLMAIPHYASGPCSRASAPPCVIDSLTIVNHPVYGYIESVSAYGYTWAFKRDGSPVDWANDIFLNSVDRYMKEPSFGGGAPAPLKPCQKSPYDSCKFATRTLVDMTPEYGTVVESIVADGSYFLYDWVGNVLSKDSLLSIARYANGPCQYRPANTVCSFDALDNKRVNGRVIEAITAYGRYWEFDTSNLANTAPINGTGGLIGAVARFK